MKSKDISALADALGKNSKEEKRRQIRRVIRNKSPKTLITEWRTHCIDKDNKYYNSSLVILVMAILCTGYDTAKLQKTLQNEGLINHLFGGLCVLFGGKSSIFSIRSDFNFDNEKNIYDLLGYTRDTDFWWEHKEIIETVNIIILTDLKMFEKLVLKDRSYVLLSCLLNYQINVNPSDEFINSLLVKGDHVQANYGLAFAVHDIDRDLRDYEMYNRNKSISGKKKSEIDKAFASHLKDFERRFVGCSDERKVSLLFNYILCSNIYPIQFGLLLLEEKMHKYLINEIIESDKIRSMIDIVKITDMIQCCKGKSIAGRSVNKNDIYKALVDMIKNFVNEEKGIYIWDDREKQRFINICSAIPKRYLKSLYNMLVKKTESLMVLKIDEMVRHKIYLHDKGVYDICVGMMECIEVRLQPGRKIECRQRLMDI